jgi:ferredoxin
MPKQVNHREVSEDNSVPILFERKEDCCGCTACYAVCPRQAITMVVDEEGFAYPIIQPELCVRCKQCIKVCPIKSNVG